NRLGQLPSALDRRLNASLAAEHHSEDLEQVFDVLLILRDEPLELVADVGKGRPTDDVLLDPQDHLLDAIHFANLVDDELKARRRVRGRPWHRFFLSPPRISSRPNVRARTPAVLRGR